MELSVVALVVTLLITGAVAGILAGLLGVGGGIVIVPVLSFIYPLLGVSISTAVSIAAGTSLIIIIATSLSSSRAHFNADNVDASILKLWGPFTAFGAVVGAFLSAEFGGRLAAITFAIVVYAAAANMLRKQQTLNIWPRLPAKPIQVFFSSINGLISAIMGVGGGTLSVPMMTASKVPMHRAVGTSAVFGFCISVPAGIYLIAFANTPADAPIATVGFVNILSAAIILPVSVVFAPIGAKMSGILSAPTLRKLFAAFLIISGTRMLCVYILN